MHHCKDSNRPAGALLLAALWVVATHRDTCAQPSFLASSSCEVIMRDGNNYTRCQMDSVVDMQAAAGAMFSLSGDNLWEGKSTSSSGNTPADRASGQLVLGEHPSITLPAGM